MKQVKIPSNINYEYLFSSIDCKDICKKELIDAIYVVLSFLYPSPHYIKETSGFNGFKPIKNDVINKVIRNRFGDVKTLLMSQDLHASGPILIENPKYIPGVKTMSYKLNDELFSNPGEKWVNLGENAEKRLIKFENDKIKDLEEFKSQYQFLLDQYQSDITIDSEALNYVSTLKSLLLEKVDQYDGDKDEMIKRVNATIKDMNSKIRAIQKKMYRTTVSVSNHRLNSVITNLNRELRYYLRINGNRLSEIDLKSSQPYVLGSILTDSFFSRGSSTEYSLSSIFPKLSNQLNIISNKSTSDIISIIGNSIYNNKKGVPPHFMSGGLDINKEIQSYRNLPFKDGFYSHLNMTYFNGVYETQKIKDDIMLVLNLDDLKKRKHIELIQRFKSHFPNINSFIEGVNSFKSFKSAIAILLQRCESYLFLRVGCKMIYDQMKDIPFLTIHDSVLIDEKFAEGAKYIITKSITNFTKLEAGVSMKTQNDPMKDINEIVNTYWNKLKNNYKKTYMD
jgi:hypothetical protein